MSLENRSSSALFKRAEQLKRWAESDTNREPSTPSKKAKKIQFSLECVFLAACAAGDKDEVLRLLNVGADIDTSNVDGLSALHQACIDDNLDMVEFLVKHGADINKGDNEGWTPLHATASCGFISIAKYLIEQGADIAAVNNDGELAVDIAESDEMEDLLNAVLKEKGIDPDDARNKEERIMLQHAKEWLKSGKFEDIPHEKTGATALHVAASKGYIKVMATLIQAGSDVDAEDYDGWTPLHAAAHWGQKEACEILVENFCDMDKKNYVGQTAFDVSEGEMVRLLEDLRKKQVTPRKKSRLSLNEKDMSPYNQLIIEDVISSMDTVPIVELTVETEKEARSKIMEENDKNVRLSNDENQVPNLPDTTAKVPINSVPAPQSPKPALEDDDVRVPSWRKAISLRNAIKTPFRFEDDKPWSNSVPSDRIEEKTPEVALRRTQSFEADDKFYRRYCELKAKIESGNTHPVLIPPANNTNTLPMRSASLKEKQRRGLTNEDVKVPAILTPPTNTATSNTNSVLSSTIQESPAAVNAVSNSNHSSRGSAIKNGLNNIIAGEQTTMSAPSTPTASKLSPGNIFKNFFKSFVPPVRDEESETQRKAHAKRVRETRRSTQGVTLEEIKSAEQLVKKKQQQQQQLQQVSSQLNSSSTPTPEQTNADTYMQNSEPASISVSATITTGTTTVPHCQSNKNTTNTNERRPSWRLRIDNGCKFMLEDVRRNEKDTESTKENTAPSWSSTQPMANSELTDTASVTIPLRKNNKIAEDSEPVKTEKDKSLPTTQPINPRRKKTKRRSTGNVSFDPDEENDRLNCDTNEVNDIANNDSGTGEKSGPPSRLSSTSSLGDADYPNRSPVTCSPSENGELDYKKLYEETLSENERLREKLKKTEDELDDCKSRLSDSSKSSANKNSLSELEKREKRAMERKLSEMEEELKQIEQIKQENQRLKDENGALIRVISKLSK